MLKMKCEKIEEKKALKLTATARTYDCEEEKKKNL